MRSSTPGPNKAVNIPSLSDVCGKEKAADTFPGRDLHQLRVFFPSRQRFSSVRVINIKPATADLSSDEKYMALVISLFENREMNNVDNNEIIDF